MKNTLTLSILYMMILNGHMTREANIQGLDSKLSSSLTNDDMDFIISAQRKYCVTTHHCQSTVTPITDVNMTTVLKTRLKNQIDIQPAFCCEQCICNDFCCCSSDNIPNTDKDKTQLSCVHPQFKPWHLNLYSYPNNENSYLMSMDCLNVDITDSLFSNDSNGNELLTPPVFDTKNNISYENSLCPKFNDKSNDHLVPWDAVLECSDGAFQVSTSHSLMEKLINNTNCNFIYYPPMISEISKCVPLIDRCNVTGKWTSYEFVIEKACMLYTAPYARTYRNMFCYICNKDIENINEIDKCTGEQTDPNSGKVTLSMLLRTDNDFATDDIDEKSLSKDTDEYPLHCAGQTLYDSLQKTCVSATCMAPYVFLKGECVNVAKRIGGIVYRLFLVLIPKFKMENVKSDVDEIETYIINMIDKMKLFDRLTILSIHENKKTSEDAFLVVHIDLYIGKGYDKMVETESIEQLTRIKTIGIDLSDSTTNVSNTYFVFYDMYDILYNERSVYNITLRNDNENETITLKRIKERSLNVKYPDIYVMVLYPMSFCPLMALSTSFYNISILRRHVYIGRYNVKLNRSEFILQDDSLNNGEKSVFVCFDKYKRLTEVEVSKSNEGAAFYQNPIVAVAYIILKVFAFSKCN